MRKLLNNMKPKKFCEHVKHYIKKHTQFDIIMVDRLMKKKIHIFQL
jgi:ribosomal protein L31E